MTKDFWLNLPVSNLKRSIDFYTKAGFKFKTDSPGYTDISAPLVVSSKNIIVMLFEASFFKNVCGIDAADATKGVEVMLSIDAESREEVDEWAQKAEIAGANVFGKPGESQGWMYGCGFADPDGHRWNVLFMDMDKMPK